MKTITTKLEYAAPMDFDRWLQNHGPKKDQPAPKPAAPAIDPVEDDYNDSLDAEREMKAKEDELVHTMEQELSNRGYRAKFRDISDFLFGGGGGGGKFLQDLCDNFGYNDGATSYEENEDFWKMMGIDREAYDFMVNRSV